MTIHLLSWLLSVGGAALFFGIGYVASGIRKGRQGEESVKTPSWPAAMAESSPAKGDDGQLASLKQQLSSAQQAQREAEQKTQQARAEADQGLQRARGEVEQQQRARGEAEQRLQSLKQERERLVLELTEARQELARHGDAEDTATGLPATEAVASLSEELERSRQRVAAMERQLGSEKDLRTAAERQARAGSQELQSLKEELAQSKKAIADLVEAQERSAEEENPAEPTLVTPPPEPMDRGALANFKKQVEQERQRRMAAERQSRADTQKRQAAEKELVGVKAALAAQVDLEAEREAAEREQAGGDTAVTPIEAIVQEKLGEAQREIKRLQGKLKEADAQTQAHDALKKQKATLTKQLDQLRTELEQAKKAAAQASPAAPPAATGADEALTRLQQEHDQHKAEAQRLEQELQQQQQKASDELEALRQQLTKADGRVQELEQLEKESRDQSAVGRHEDQAELKRLTEEVAERDSKLRDALLKAQLADTRAAEIERLSEENQKLRVDYRGQEGLDLELATTQKELREAQVAAQVAESRAAEIERLLDENRNLREDMREMSELRQNLEHLAAIQNENQALRLEADVTTRRMEQFEELNAECRELRVSVATMSRESDENHELRERVQTMEAQLFALGYNPSASKWTDDMEVSQTAVHDLAMGGRIGEMMADLTLAPRLRTAVLADNQGLLVGGVGDPEYHEEIAAWTGVAEGLITRAQSILPLGNVRRLTLFDGNDLVLFCRFFSLGTDSFILSSLSQDEAPPIETVESTIQGLGSALVGSVAKESASQPPEQ
jgi:chromosome segregation ATPase